jgi:hypothetical protein
LQASVAAVAVGVELAPLHLAVQKLGDLHPGGEAVQGEVWVVAEAAEEHFVVVVI